jgi:hypothetical protein
MQKNDAKKTTRESPSRNALAKCRWEIKKTSLRFHAFQRTGTPALERPNKKAIPGNFRVFGKVTPAAVKPAGKVLCVDMIPSGKSVGWWVSMANVRVSVVVMYAEEVMLNVRGSVCPPPPLGTVI